MGRTTLVDPVSGAPYTASNPLPVTSVAGGSATVGAANLANAQVSVGTTTGGTTIAAARATRRRVIVVNLGTTDVYVGAGTVSTANGALLKGVAGAAVYLATTAAVKAIVASGTQTVAVIEEYD